MTATAQIYKCKKIAAASRQILALAFEGLNDAPETRMIIALRTPAYGERLAVMLKAFAQANAANPHHQG